MGVKLYTLDWSPPVRATMMACEIFNVPYEKIEVDLFTMDNLKPEYLKKNPLHTIPLLEDGDFILFDSHAIMAYLAETYGKDESWYPKDVKKRAQVNQKLFFDTSILFPRIRNITYPIMAEGNKIIEQKKLDALEEAFGFVEEFLSRTKYIAADHITIADVSALSTMTAMEMILPLDEKKFPKTTAWLTNLKNTPFCKKHNEFGAAQLAQVGIKLYGKDLSPPVRAAMMALEIFNVPYEMIEVNVFANEHKTPEYLKKNPLHSVPVMEDGDLILHDSHAILAYLSDAYGKDESWYPKDVKKRALVNQKLFFITSILFPRLVSVTMVVKLYTMELSPPVRASIMACDIFKVPFENIEVDLEDKQNINPEFLSKNPMKTVPVLEDDDLILHDSHAILMYLADAYGTEDTWYPKDNKTRALVNQKLLFDTTVLFPRLRNITHAVVIERRPTLKQKWLDNIEEGYGLLETFLRKTAFIATNFVTIADISAYSNMSCLVHIVPLDENKFPETSRWFREMKKQPYCVKHNNPSAAIFGDLLKQCRESTLALRT